jgi:hypothetical protein
MTEKRFTIDDESDIIEFDWENNEYLDDFMWGDGKSWDRVCNRLNELYEENQRLTDKLNQTALELVGEVISQGKAVEISEMSYSEFLDYRAKNGKMMELQL